MGNLIRLIRRVRAWLVMRDTERRLQGVIDLQRAGSYSGADFGLGLLREKLSAELANQRAEYIAAFKQPGQRMTFEVA